MHDFEHAQHPNFFDNGPTERLVFAKSCHEVVTTRRLDLFAKPGRQKISQVPIH